jgi:hypothetical protein
MPEWKPEILRRLASLSLAAAREAEIADELAQHLEDRYQELVSSGQPEDAAFRAALDELKGEDLLALSLKPVEKAFYREPVVPGKAGTNFLEGILQDVRYAFRMLHKSPGFAAVAILTLALGIGANTAIFSLVDCLVLRPIPVERPGEVVFLTSARWAAARAQSSRIRTLPTSKNRPPPSFLECPQPEYSRWMAWP